LAGSVRTNNQKAIPVKVAEEKLRRHGIFNNDIDRDKPRPAGPDASNFCVYVNASRAKSCVVRLNVRRRERAVCLIAADQLALSRWNKCDGVGRPRRGHLNPAMTSPVGEIDTFLEPEFVEIELKGIVNLSENRG
jgi:hypothetical protein